MADDENESDGAAQGGIDVSAAEHIATMQWTRSVSELGAVLHHLVDEATILDTQHSARSAASRHSSFFGHSSGDNAF